jgi:hypothetical protein
VTGDETTTEERAAHVVQLLKTYFFQRTDKVAAFMRWDRPHPIEAGDNLEALLLAHVLGEAAPTAVVRYVTKKGATKAEKGRYRIGSYTPDSEGKTRWLCLDFDGGGHADGLVDPEAAVLLTHERSAALDLPSHIERSGGGKGWHLWLFFSEPVPAKDVRKFAHLLVPGDQILASGRCADARVNRGIEVFPKQNKIKKNGFGNLVWLPFWSEAPDGATRFYRLEADTLQQYEPEAFDTVTPEKLSAALDSLDQQDRATGDNQDAGEGADRAVADRAVADDEAVQAFLNRVDKDESAGPPPSQNWRRWREEALANLPIERVYSDILTGDSSGEHWLRCQDPDSPSGPDSRSGSVADGNGDAPKGTFHSFRTEETMSVFDFMVRHGHASSFQDALKKVAEMSGVPLPAHTKPSRSRTGTTARSSKGFPRIVVNARQLRDIIWDTRQVLAAANAARPFLFLRSGRPVRLVHVGGTPQVDFIDETAMYGVIARLADWVKRTDEADFDAMPPLSVAKDLVASPDPGLPILEAVLTAPTFDRNGTLMSAPGYHRDAEAWYHELPGFSLPPVPEEPTDADVDAARSLLLDDLLVDFPFVSKADKAHAVAALVLPFVRRLIPGPTPIHLFEASTPGAGKTLLAETVAMVVTGRGAEPMTLGRDDEETRKKITSMLSLGREVVLIDNVRSGIDSANLAAALTADIWQDRLLGQNKMVRFPNRAVWLVTANNPSLSLEIARRSVRIRIEPAGDRPWQREGFKHLPLKPWVKENRSHLVWAILVLVNAWLAGGAPAGARTLGSFEDWAGVIGGILMVAGIPGFLGNAEELYEAADVEGQEWREFAWAWWEQHSKAPVSAGTLLHLAKDRDMLLTVLGSKSERSQAIRLGKSLKANRNRTFDGFLVEATWAKHGKQNQWRLMQVEDQVDDGAEGDVLDLFGPRDVEPSRDVENLTSRGTSRVDSETIAGGSNDRGMLRDVNPYLAGAIRRGDAQTDGRPSDMRACAPRANPGTHPATSRDGQKSQSVQSDPPRDVPDQHPAQHPATSRQHPASGLDDPDMDLANLENEEEE